MNLKLVAPDNPVLGLVAPRFGGDPRDLRQTAAAMFQVMHQRHGAGIAAPQVGLQLRMFLMNLHQPALRRFSNSYVCVNPEVLTAGGHPVEMIEGCITWPGRGARVMRSEQILVRYTDLRAKEHQDEFFGHVARCFQHELDHLNGVTIFPRMPRATADDSDSKPSEPQTPVMPAAAQPDACTPA